MAAGTLQPPGSEYGPCALGKDGNPSCEHTDCWHTNGMANQPCVYCGEPIGYEAGFFDETSYDERNVGVQTLAHELCSYEDTEKRR